MRRHIHLPVSGIVCRVCVFATCALMATAPARALTVEINSSQQVANGSSYVLSAGNSLLITTTGELNAPFGSPGSGISLLGDVVNQGKLRAGFGSEIRGLFLGGLQTFNDTSGLIEADQISLASNSRLVNGGQLITGSYTLPFVSPNGATVLTIPSLGGFFSGTASTINNSANWISHANVTVRGTLDNHATFFSQNNAQYFLDNPLPAAPYGQAITLIAASNNGGVQPVIHNYDRGTFAIGAGTTLFNNALVVNAGLMAVSGRVDNQVSSLGSNVFPNPDAFKNLSTGELRIDRGGSFNLSPRGFADSFNNDGLIGVSGSFTSSASVLNRNNIQIGAGGQMQTNGGGLTNVFVGLTNAFGAILRVNANGSLTGDHIANGGQVTVGGVATFYSAENSGILDIGIGGSGSLAINYSLRNQPGGVLRIAGNGSLTGRSDIQNYGDVTVEATGRLEAASMLHAAGTLTVDGTLDMFGGILTMTGGVLNGNGSVNGDARINGAPFSNGGVGVATFTPGHSPGHMDISGALTFGRGGVLQLDVERGLDGVLHWDTVSAASISFEPGSVISVVITDDASDQALPSLSLNFLTCTRKASCNFAPASFEVLGSSPGSPFENAVLEIGANGLSFALAPVPEPATWVFMLAGLGLVVWVRRHALAHEGEIDRMARVDAACRLSRYLRTKPVLRRCGTTCGRCSSPRLAD